MEHEKKELTIKWLKRILPLMLGALGGYLYYSFIGCINGTCLITSNPWTSTIVGTIIGAAFIPKSKSKEQKAG